MNLHPLTKIYMHPGNSFFIRYTYNYNHVKQNVVRAGKVKFHIFVNNILVEPEDVYMFMMNTYFVQWNQLLAMFDDPEYELRCEKIGS